MTRDAIITGSGVVIGADDIEERFIRASGPGGQNVNKVSTAVQLRFDARNSPALDDTVRQRLLAIAGRRANRNGVIIIEARRFRTQEQNRADAVRRLVALVDEAAAPPPPPRKKTRPTRSAVERRLRAKGERSRTKRLRGAVGKSGDP